MSAFFSATREAPSITFHTKYLGPYQRGPIGASPAARAEDHHQAEAEERARITALGCARSAATTTGRG
jgi:hypothetical protein